MWSVVTMHKASTCYEQATGDRFNMRTQDWRSANAPDGPKLWIRCAKCGEKAVQLSAGTSIAFGGTGVHKESNCTKCGEPIKYRVSNE